MLFSGPLHSQTDPTSGLAPMSNLAQYRHNFSLAFCTLLPGLCHMTLLPDLICHNDRECVSLEAHSSSELAKDQPLMVT